MRSVGRAPCMMAKNVRGDAEIEIGGETHILRYDFNSMANIDQQLGGSFLQMLSQGNMHAVRVGLIAGINNPRNARGAGVKAARKFNLGELDYYIDCMLDAMEAAGVIPARDENEGEAPAPRRGKAVSTGTSSAE